MPRKREDLTGRKFGRLTVVGYDRTSPHGDTYWLCKCDCGNPALVSVIRHSLTSGGTKSCGCLVHESEDLTGQHFNRLTVLGFAGRDHEGKGRWRCRCDCGNETIVDGWNLKVGQVKSCGCLRNEGIHGHSSDDIYQIWKAMRGRCNNSNHQVYKHYGGRGIFVCQEWDESFQAFYDWAMNNGYRKGLWLDRIDNDDGYYPDNCRWATIVEQANNKRTSRYITYCGVTNTIAEWARVFNVTYSSLLWRINHNDMQDFERYFMEDN